MTKKGFIATSLIYSFFLVFCAVILSYIGISTHNKNLLNRANENIRKDIDEKTVSDLSIGAIVSLDVSTPFLDLNSLKWHVFNNDGNSAELVSSSIVFSSADIEYIKYLTSTLYNDCVIDGARIFTKKDLFTTVKNNVTDTRILRSIVNAENVAGANTDYLLIDNDTLFKYTYKEPNDSNASLTNYIETALSESESNSLPTYTANETKNVRIVIKLSGNSKVFSGSGTISNPYQIDENTCYGSLSLANKILSNGYDNKTNYTTPGTQAAIADEGIRTTEDDYGTSFYFRGDVKNNYIVFAEKCWRIVRITGNGGVKLILQNYNDRNCNVKPNMNYIYSENSILKAPFNINADSNTYIGYKFKDNGSTYNDTHINVQESNILSLLRAWYNDNFTDDEKEKIADAIWCNDKSLNAGATTGYGQIETNYSGYYRISDSSLSPSLKCPNGSGNDAKISKFTSNETLYGNGTLNGYKIGLLTADEVAFAGLTSDDNNILINRSYLMSSDVWWTLTPMAYSDNSAKVYAVDSFGTIKGYAVNDSSIGIRPSITLSPKVMTSGSGTINNPYVVK